MANTIPDITKVTSTVTAAQAQTGADRALQDLKTVASQIAANNAAIEALVAKAAPIEKIGARPPRDLVTQAQQLKREAVLLRAKYQQQAIIAGWMKSIAKGKSEAQQARDRKDFATAALKEGAVQVLVDAVKKLGQTPPKIKLPDAPSPTPTPVPSGGVHGLGLLRSNLTTIGSRLATATATKPAPAPAPTPTPKPSLTAASINVKPNLNPGVAPTPTSTVPKTPLQTLALTHRKSPLELMKEQQKDLEEARKHYPSDPNHYGGKQGRPLSNWAEKSQWTAGLNAVQLRVLDWAPPPTKMEDGKEVEDGSTSTVIKAMSAIPPEKREQWFWDTYIATSDPISLRDPHPQWVVDLQAGNLGRHGIGGFMQDVGDFVVDNAGVIATVAATAVAVVAAVPSGGLSLAAIPAIVSAGAGAAATATAISKAAAPLQKEVQTLTSGDSADVLKYAPKPGAPTAQGYLVQKQQAAATSSTGSTVVGGAGATGTAPATTSMGAPTTAQTVAASGAPAAAVAGPQPAGALFADPTAALTALPLPKVTASAFATIPKGALLAGGGLVAVGLVAYALKGKSTPARAPAAAPVTA